MATLPVISIKSKDLQRELGVKTYKGAKEKLIRDFGVTIIDHEYISVRELERIVDTKLRKVSSPGGEVSASRRTEGDFLTGTSLENYKD